MIVLEISTNFDILGVNYHRWYCEYNFVLLDEVFFIFIDLLDMTKDVLKVNNYNIKDRQIRKENIKCTKKLNFQKVL